MFLWITVMKIFRAGISVQEISEQILKEYRKAAGNVSLLSQQDIWSYERIKDRLYVEMVNIGSGMSSIWSINTMFHFSIWRLYIT